MVEIPFSASVLATVVGFVFLSAFLIVGPTRLRETVRSIRPRIEAAWPALTVLGGVLVVNSIIRDSGGDLSWLIGIEITPYIHTVEGAFVHHLQSLATPELTSYFSFIYVYGYAFLLIFPVVLYLTLDDSEPLRELAIAYTLNYAIGLVFYILFIAYGPRNYMPMLVESLLYTDWPKAQLLTSQVNRNTNVFPSLHSSLSLTVGLMAYRSYDTYPLWLYLSVPIAASVSISTMYLGIHWATDVLIGFLLGGFSIYAAPRVRRFDWPFELSAPTWFRNLRE